jgi:hypothetical protein
MDMRDHAVALAKKGFRVIKLRVGDKPPQSKGWQKAATNDPKEVYKLWTAPVTFEPLPNNIGIVTGNGLLVLDVDIKGGRPGVESHRLLVDDFELPESTFSTHTVSGGRHYFFQVPPGVKVKNSANVLAPGLDVRGDGGYVVAPGSTIGGSVYRVANDDQIAIAPPWLVEQCQENDTKQLSPRTTQQGAVLTNNSPGDVERAREWLSNDAEHAIEGAGGDHTTYVTICRVRDFGVGKDTALDLLLDVWNINCSPPWSVDDLQVKVENAYSYAQNAQGVLSPRADFGHLFTETQPPSIAKSNRRQLVDLRTLRANATQLSIEPLIEDLLTAAAMSVVYGESNSGKSFWALYVAFCVATGRPWWGKPVAQGGVVYLAAEGGPGLYKRIAAMCQEMGVDDAPFWAAPWPIDLLRPADREMLAGLIRDMGVRPKLIVVDTLSRALAGGDENSPTDMGNLVKNLDWLRDATGAHIMVIHHSGKDRAKGARGHSLLRAATDTEIEIERGKWTVMKQRDVDGEMRGHFELRGVEVGTDAKGRRVTSAVVRMMSEFEAPPLTPAEQRWLAMFTDVLGGDTENVYTVTQIRAKVAGKLSPATPPARQSLQETLQALAGKGYLQRNSTKPETYQLLQVSAGECR